ncbi:hypothetical protein LMG23992_01737 [Cupriavidus laharis]|uniref:HTH luxR-type domain-containing protein n=2 Tax=Cupriavidus laharis TaxID=151654 RepID=A0ABN7YF59_9BURK|nr:hypothetical protein LMG23992_01737 [Cupriavidus laharis]
MLRRALEAAHHLEDRTPPWMDILSAARDVVGADSGSLLMFDGTGALLHLSQVGVDANGERDYREHYHALDLFARDAMCQPAGQWLDTSRMYPLSQFRNTEYYADFMVKYRMAQVQAYILADAPNLRAAISFQRSTVDMRAADRFVHGPVAAFFHTLRDRIARRQHAVYSHLANLEEAFSSFDEAICLVGATGAVIRVSPLAQEIFASPLFAARHGVLWHADPRMHAMLLRHVAAACQTGMRQTMTIPAGSGVTVTIDMAIAGPSLRIAGECCVLMRMQRRDSGGTQPDPDRLAAAFHITPAEARVLAALVSGQTATAYAASAGVSVNTVRKQIAMLMTKMHCNRQSELVRKAILGQG